MVSQPLLVVIVAGDCPGRCRVFSSILGFPDGSAIKNLIVKQETWVQSLGREDPLEEGVVTHSSIFALENPMDKGARQAIVLRVTQSWTRLKRLSTHTCMHPSIELGGVDFWCTSMYVWHGSSGHRMQEGGPRNGLKLLLSIIGPRCRER